MVASACRQLFEVWEFPLFHESIGKHGILAVEADHDQAFDPWLRPLLTSEGLKKGPEGPQEYRDRRKDDRGEENQDR
jgi:hypothetical protein